MAQFVFTPPRAAETKEPVTMVGAAAAGGAGSLGGLGAKGTWVPAVDTGVA
ncbi:hypothetical protein I550_0381 [Mycobacterium intracellulare 1956]|uniref:Uncharacterized protein n=1 Tax=Mycobacterium intracellulare 1956 TaxID=1299331 RepID=X8CPR8_MYCIT|nr:hypothetical protein I548_3363 [Mycobacterium intracellulare]EUA57260.1 hypothetical protein I550_0381 [Mycobacterium intracellulare 1956]